MGTGRKNSNSCGRPRTGANIGHQPTNGARVGEDFMPVRVILANESSVELKWSNMPALAHRARYENELSKRGNCRGAIEGRTSDFPSVKIHGLERVPCAPSELNVTVYVCMPDGRPHPFFYCKTAGRDAPASCQSTQLKDGTHILRQVVKASNGYTCELRHVGIVRLRQGQDLTNGESAANRTAAPSQANFFRLCVMTELATAEGQQLSVISEPIKCISSTQSVLKPKISQIVNTGALSETGRAEVFIFGKDFTPNTKFRVFQKLADGRVWQELVDDENCSWFCTHHCCAKVRLPLLPSEFGPKGTAINVRLEGVPHSARRPADTVAPNWVEASTLEYPAEAPRAACSQLVPKQKPARVVMPQPSTKRQAEDDITVDEPEIGWLPGRAKSPRSSPLPTSPSSPKFHNELKMPTPNPVHPPANFQPPPVQPPAFQPDITHLDSYIPSLPVHVPLNTFPSISGTTPYMKSISTLASDVWTMPPAQATAQPPQPPTFATIFDDLSMSGSPTSNSDFSSSCGSPYQDVFAPSEDDIWPLLDFWDVNDTNFPNQVATALSQ